MIRLLIMVCAMFTNGLGMTLMRYSCLGTEPFSCLNYSLCEFFGISMGISAAIINGAVFLLDLVVMRELLGIGTAATILFLGTAADIWNSLLTTALGYTVSFDGMEQLPLRLVLLVAGMFTMIVSNSFIMSCELGISPYDTLGYIVEKYTKHIPFKWARVFFDCACVASAYLFASQTKTQWELIGLGTILMAFCIGPFITLFRTKLTNDFVRDLADKYK